MQSRLSRATTYVLIGSLALFCVPGCVLHRADIAPAPLTTPPEAYSMDSGGVAQTGPWWKAFGDDRLDSLIETALSHNLTAAQALERIHQAGLLLRQANALRKPELEYAMQGERSYTRTRDKSAREDAEEASWDALAAGRTELPDRNSTTESRDAEFTPEFSFRWELDLWGRLRNAAQAQGELWTAATLDYQAFQLYLSSQVADTYYQAMEQRLQLDLLREQLESSKRVLELLELRFLQGGASVVDVLQQRGQAAAIEVDIPAAEAELRLLENRLDVLLGCPPDGQDRVGTDSPPVLPDNAALPALGVPADLLQRRPDLLALQRRVTAADYRIGVAVADRLPRVTLDASLGYRETLDTATFSGAGALGLLQPLWDWGLREAAVLEAQSQVRESLLAYTQAYHEALEEVETALYQEQRQRELIDILTLREEIVQRTLNETQSRYGLGVTDYLPVLTAIQDLQRVQRELLRQRRLLVSLRIELHRGRRR